MKLSKEMKFGRKNKIIEVNLCRVFNIMDFNGR